MADEELNMAVGLNIHTFQLEKFNGVYYLNNIDNIIKQLFEGTSYIHSAKIGDNQEGCLCVIGQSGQPNIMMMLFELRFNLSYGSYNLPQNWAIHGNIKLAKFVENQREIKGKLVATLLGYPGNGLISPIKVLPELEVSLKKVETSEE